jgi:hypothetical protein
MLPSLKNFAYSFDELDIHVAQVEEAMGYGKGQLPEPFPEMICTALGLSSDLCNIQGSLMIPDNFSLDSSGVIETGGVTFFVGKKIAAQLKHAEGGALFICTAGAGIGEKSKDLIAGGELIEGYILDVIGSVTVEAAIDKIQESFQLEMTDAGKKIANRYSPGSCGWALIEQKQFFRLFPENHCGIRLSDSCLMDPIKSVSGIIGFGTNIRKTVFECQMCELETCVYRVLRLTRGK